MVEKKYSIFYKTKNKSMLSQWIKKFHLSKNNQTVSGFPPNHSRPARLKARRIAPPFVTSEYRLHLPPAAVLVSINSRVSVCGARTNLRALRANPRFLSTAAPTSLLAVSPTGSARARYHLLRNAQSVKHKAIYYDGATSHPS